MKKTAKAVLSRLGDVKGWKRDAKKIGAIFAVIIVIALTPVLLKMCGVHMTFNVERFKSAHVDQQELPIRFSYPARYQLDGDTEKRFGENYIIGFKLPSDPRVGCDVRKTDARLNMAKSDADISAAINKELSAAAKDFKLLSVKRLNVGGENGFETDFTMKDPINSTIRMKQILVSHGDQGYALVCGSQELLFERVSPDFDDFVSSIKWK